MSIFNILFLTFCILFIASAVMEIISYKKHLKKLEYAAKPMMYVFLLVSALMILIPLIPDSINIVVYLSIAILTGLAGAQVQFLAKTKKTVITSSLLFIVGFICWINLIRPSFWLYTLPAIANILIILIYGGLLALFYIRYTGKQDPSKTAGIILYMVPLAILHYGTILTLCGQPAIYSIVLVAGSSTMMASQAMIVKGFFIHASEKDRLTRMILYISAQFLITAGFTLMVRI